MRAGTFISTLCVALAGAGAYLLIYMGNETRALENKVKALHETIIAERTSLYVLEADRTYLTRPARMMEVLTAVDERYATLSAPDAHQFVTVRDIPYGASPLPPVASYESKVPAARKSRP